MGYILQLPTRSTIPDAEWANTSYGRWGWRTPSDCDVHRYQNGKFITNLSVKLIQS
jgi:hypothetical protein